MEKRVLILGGSYFIGKKIATLLNEYGYDVSILNRGTKPIPGDGINQIICDRNDSHKMKEVLKNKYFDFVVDVSWKDISWVESVCDSLPFNTVKNYIFISSSAVYDVEHLTTPYSESDFLAENKYWSSYGKGKIEAEQYYIKFFEKKNTNLIILRPPYIYGEDNYAQRESLIFKLITEGSPVIIPKMNPKLQFIYAEDLGKIINVFFIRKNEKLEIYNVGNKEPVTARDWVQVCADIAEKPVHIIEYDYQIMNRNVRDFFPFFDYDNVLDVHRINKLISSEMPFKKGLSRAYDWFQEHKEEIEFKKIIEKNLYEIIAELN